MHFVKAKTISLIVCIFWLAANSLVSSMDVPPCMSQLGMRVDAYDDSFRFDLAVSSGVAEDVRLNGKQAWIPKQFADSYVQINVTKAVLLTGLQIQGDPESSGRLTAWTLQTSLDCINYRTENYTLDYRNTLQASTVLLENVEFVTCIILRPTEYKGRLPALRLELLGCVLSESDKCHHATTPVSDEWMVDGGRQLNYDHDIVLVWIQVQLDLDIPGDFGEIGIYYSRNCQIWKFYEPSDMNIVSLTSSDQRDRLVTLELNTPVRAKCLRIFPPLAARIQEIQINECSGHSTSRLYESKSQKKNSMKKFGKDSNAYQDEPCLYQMASQGDAPEMPFDKDKRPPENLKDIITKGKLPDDGDSKKQQPEDGKDQPKPLIKQQPDQNSPTPLLILNNEVNNDLTLSDLNTPTTKSSFSNPSEELISQSHDLDMSTPTMPIIKSPEPPTVTPVPQSDQDFTGKYENIRSESQDGEGEEILIENVTFLLDENETLFINTTKHSGNDLLQSHSVEVKQNKSSNTDPSESILVPMDVANNEIQVKVNTREESITDVSSDYSRDSTTSYELSTNDELTSETVHGQDLNSKEAQVSQNEDIKTSKPNDIQTPKHDEIQTTRYEAIQASRHDDIQASENDEIQTSRLEEIPTSKHDDIQKSEPDDIQKSKHDEIQTSKPDEIQRSKHIDDIKTSKHIDDIQTSKHIDDIKTSKHIDDIQTSKHIDDIQTSTPDNVQTPKHDEIPTIRHDDIQTSESDDIQTSKYDDIQTSKYDEIQTSLKNDDISLSSQTNREALEEFQNSNENANDQTKVTQTVNNSSDEINSEVSEKTSSIATAAIRLSTVGTNDIETKSSLKVPEVGSDETNTHSNSSSYRLMNNPPLCGVKSQEAGARRKRIIGGYRNSPGEWPWLVTMFYYPEFPYTMNSGYKHLCGASLIAPSWIITAGHCFAEVAFQGLGNASNWKIIIGIYDLEDDKNSVIQERLISDYIVYPTYDITKGPLIDDLALVRLNKPVEISNMVFPICLDNTDIFYNETQCYVTGWGNLDINSTGSRFPHTTLLTLLTQENCKHMFDILPETSPVKPFINISAPVLCARVGPEGQDACQGDSGGPLMCDIDGYWYQVGVVAAGHGCGNIEIPGLYTRISYFYDWINETISGYKGSTDDW